MRPGKENAQLQNRVNVAAVTMTYNEPDFLPIWVRHYSSQVGPKNCYVVDHGTSDGSTEALRDVNVLKIPRSPYDDERNARFLSAFCSSLLEWHDFVLHTDVDEMLVADPERYASLTEFCASCGQDVITAIGFNVVHTSDDLPVVPTARILEQRKWMYFSAALSKPALTRRPLVWGAGFHQVLQDVETRFDDLYLFHLRFFDRDVALRRLAKTRAQPWADPDACWWQRIPDDKCLQWFMRYDCRPKNKAVEVSKTSPEVLAAIAGTLGSSGGRLGEPDTVNLNYEADELWPIPQRFGSAF